MSGGLARRLLRRRGPRPAVSIVVATHNRASLLPLALDSALAQDYPDLEVLVMDDGSTDETREVLAGYARRLAPERFRFESHANMGQARTLNRGYELARGELIGYLSDDDMVAPQLVSRLVRALGERPEASAAFPAYRLIDGGGAVLDTWLPLEYTGATALSRHDTIIGPGGLARRAALEASGGWDPQYRWMGDLIMWMGVARSGPVLRVAEPLASWRKHPEGATSATGVERASEHLRLLEHGLALEPSVAVDRVLRAEALRNACAVAAWFAGYTNFAPGEPITMVDQDRTLISAWASGQEPASPRFDAGRAARVTAALRSLGELTLELADARASGSGENAGSAEPPGGYERALERLRAVGALGPASGGGPAGAGRAPLDEAALGPALIAAALDCAADVPAGRRRFLIPDRRQAQLVADELQALVGLTLAAQAHGLGLYDAVQAEVARRRDDLARVSASAPRPA
ncbi:MAG TPA: glycosyltransferase family A protein [Solirubrobacteraceae bacterium]|nr:glycosyltransferase family A protein [Solirubrobacteraceae bacterium]